MPDTTIAITGSQIIYGLILLLFVAMLGIVGWKWLRAFLLSVQCWMAKVEAGIVQLLLLQLRGADIAALVNTAITAKRDAVDANLDQLAHHQLAGGNIRLVVSAMLSAKRYSFPLTFERAAAIDLLGRDPVQLVAEAVYEANQIRLPQPAGATGLVKDALAPIAPEIAINSAAVLLRATPGVVGVVVGEPRVRAQMRFPQGELQVLVHCRTVPKDGDRLRIVQVDGMTVVAAPAEAEAKPTGSPA
jgi:uncharacterized protein YqfA (UPF0365 family)